MANIIKAIVRGQRLSITVPQLVAKTANYINIVLQANEAWNNTQIVCFLTKVNDIASNQQVACRKRYRCIRNRNADLCNV